MLKIICATYIFLLHFDLECIYSNHQQGDRDMQIVSTIRKGHRIKTQDNVLTVLGSSKLRGGYYYIVADKHDKRFSISRDEVLEAQRDGSATVVA